MIRWWIFIGSGELKRYEVAAASRERLRINAAARRERLDIDALAIETFRRTNRR